MSRFLPLLAVLAVAAAPAAAQTAASQQPAGEAPRTATKVVCQRVNVEEETGSRLGAAPKVCKKVVVPADASDRKPRDRDAPNQSGYAH